MDVILKVLKGAKQGTKVAIKKETFLIGRSQKCNLCVASSSVSRRHCKFSRQESKVLLRDLGSRNGTYVNGEKITEEIELSTGDEISVGSLSFMITLTPGIANEKRSKVRTVADAVERAASSSDPQIQEEDISDWLLDVPSGAQAITETQTIRMDDTNAIQSKTEQTNIENQEGLETVDVEAEEDSAEGEDDDDNGDSKSDTKKKKKPGKLPPLPDQQSAKDSREAAMEALRNWNRRR